MSFLFQYYFKYYFKKPVFTETDMLQGKVYVDYLKRWQKPGDELHTNVPALLFPSLPDAQAELFYSQSDVNFLKADNIRLSSGINISYTVPKTNGKRGMGDLTFTVNIGGIGGILWVANSEGLNPDAPEASLKPSSKTVSFSINAKL